MGKAGFTVMMPATPDFCSAPGIPERSSNPRISVSNVTLTSASSPLSEDSSLLLLIPLSTQDCFYLCKHLFIDPCRQEVGRVLFVCGPLHNSVEERPFNDSYFTEVLRNSLLAQG